MQRMALVVWADRAGEFKQVCLDTSPIDCLFHSGRIDAETYAAAERYAAAWEASGLRPSVGCNYDRPVDCGRSVTSAYEAMSYAQHRAWREWEQARTAIPEEARRVVDDVVLWWRAPARKALVRLGNGLDALVRFYAGSA